MEEAQARKIDVATIHDIDRARFGHDQIQGVDIVQLAVGDVDEARYVAAKIKQRVHLHRRFGAAKMCPREHRQAQVDGGRVQRIDAVVQVHSKVFAGVQGSRLSNQALGEIGMDAPVARLVGISQCGAPDRLTKAHVVELAALRRQACLDIAQALAVRQLCEGHHAELLGAGQGAGPLIATVAVNATGKRRPWEDVHQLGEQGLAGVHGDLRGKAWKAARPAQRRSNRHRPLVARKTLSDKALSGSSFD